MSSSLADKQNDLQARVDAIDQEIGECDTAFTELALQFSGLDGKESLKQAAQLETRLAALRREKSLALAAQAHITREQLAEKEAQADKDRRAVLATAKEHASAIITLNDEIDQHLIKLRELFERRFSVLSQLSATAVVDQSFIVKLQGKSGPTRALCAAGLAKYVSVEKVATQSYVSLASVNPILLGIGRDAGVPPGRTTNGGDASNSVPRHRRTEVIP